MIATVLPAGIVKEREERISRVDADEDEEVFGYENETSLNTICGPAFLLSRRSWAFGGEKIAGFKDWSLNIVSISISDCRVSRYTVPKKLRGRLSWNTRPLTMTRSPTVKAPATMPWLARYIMNVRDIEKMTFWPIFK